MRTRIVSPLFAVVGFATSATPQTARLGSGVSLHQDQIFAPYRACVARVISHSSASALVDFTVYRTVYDACEQEKERALTIATERLGLGTTERSDLRINTGRDLADAVEQAIIAELSVRRIRWSAPPPVIRGYRSQ